MVARHPLQRLGSAVRFSGTLADDVFALKRFPGNISVFWAPAVCNRSGNAGELVVFGLGWSAFRRDFRGSV